MPPVKKLLGPESMTPRVVRVINVAMQGRVM